MITFLDFLTEASAGADSDFQGKAFELELAKHLHPEGKLPKHFNDESGRSPQVVSNDLRQKLGHETYESISAHAKRAAQAHIKKTGHRDIEDVHWTSQKGQVSKLTRKNEDENPSDLVYTRANGEHHGISAKFGKSVGARSPGMEDLAKMSGVPHTELKSMQQEHRAAVDKEMSEHITASSDKGKHEQFKDLAAGTGAGKAATERASVVSHSHRSRMAARISSGLSGIAATDHERMHGIVMRLGGAPEAETNMFKVHHNPVKNETHISTPTEDFDSLKSKVHHYSVSHTGTTISIHAHDHTGQRIGTVLSMNIKNKSSSPYTSVSGSSKLGPVFKKL